MVYKSGKILSLLLFFLCLQSIRSDPFCQKGQETNESFQNIQKYKRKQAGQISSSEEDFGKYNIFLQPEQKFVLVPALLFATQSSFKKQYRLEIVQATQQQSLQPTQSMNKSNSSQSSASQTFNISEQELNIPDLYEIHPALQKLNSYNLTSVKGLNVTDCAILDVYFQDDDTPFIVCLRKSKQVEVHRIDISGIMFEFSFKVAYLWNQMNIISISEIVFYNMSNIFYYSYNKEKNVLVWSETKVEDDLQIQECETYVEDGPNGAVQNFNLQKLYQICHTNNNQISKTTVPLLFNPSLFSDLKLSQIKKDFVLMFLIDSKSIKQLNRFEIPQRNSTFNHVVGFDIIDSLEKVVMMCYNMYKINVTKYDSGKDGQEGHQMLDQTLFTSSYCSIFKIYQQNDEMVLVNRMQLQSSPFPLLETSLQINVMLAVATQVSITFYHLDILKEMFQYVQKIYIPTSQDFNCYQKSTLSNSYDSVSLTCAKNQEDSTTVSFVMVFDEDLGKYIPVGNVFVGSEFFHSAQLVFVINQKQLIVLKANQQYVLFDYTQNKTQIRVYQADINITNKTDPEQRYATIIMNPAQSGAVYVDQPLPLIQQINYDVSYQMDLKGAFQGSNISFLKLEAVDDKGNVIDDHEMIKNDRIYFYEYSLLISVYIREECIRVIKISDTSFYRILEIEKSRVDGGDSQGNAQEAEQGTNSQQDEDEYYYYTETCNKVKDSFICQLTEIHSASSVSFYEENNEYEDENHYERSEQRDSFQTEQSYLHKLIDIQFLLYQDTFVYLYSFNETIEKLKSLNYGMMFLSMRKPDQNESNFEFFNLQSLIEDVFKTFFVQTDESFQSIEKIKSIRLKKDWLVIEAQSQKKKTQVFCLLTHIKAYLFREDHPNDISLKNLCIFQSTNTSVSMLKSHFIQQDTLILAETLYNKQNSSRIKKIKIFNVLRQQSIVKKGTFWLTQQIKGLNNNKDAYSLDDDIEYIGLYKQYIIIVNSTTISKYYLQVNLELVYQFTFNPQFIDHTKSKSQSRQNRNTYQIKYVLFLQKYLIVQFQSFYQLYNIGQQLISIQIASNNFNSYLQSLDPSSQISVKLKSLKSSNDMSNVIINDAFLIQGDNIMIIQKDHLVVAKYVTNPTLELGPLQESHLVVESRLEVRIKPILDNFNFQEVYQQVLFKILYSHYVVQKIAKNIKTLTVPSMTQNYQLQIWTNVFRGPVIEYYLSDTFDGKMVLKQHLTEIQDDLKPSQENSNDDNVPFTIIQSNRPYPGRYNLKSNTSHFLVQDTKTEAKSYLEVTEGLKDDFFLKFTEITSSQKQKANLICILTLKRMIFLRIEQSKSFKQGKKSTILSIIDHNISIILNEQTLPILPQSSIQSLSKDNQFYVVLWFSSQEEDQNQQPQLLQSQIFQGKSSTKTNLHIFQLSLDQQLTDVTIQLEQKLNTIQEIVQVKSVQSSEDTNTHDKDELYVLTYMQNLLVYRLVVPNKEESNITELIQLKQKIYIKDNVPIEYRSNEKYMDFEIFMATKKNAPSSSFRDNPSQQSTQIKANNITLLLFAQTDLAFHIEFQIYFLEGSNSSFEQQKPEYSLRLANIYASHMNFNFFKVVSIGFSQQIPPQCFPTSSSQDHKNDSTQFTTVPPYLYFVALYQYQPQDQIYLIYYGYNYNFTVVDKQVGYFKCGEELQEKNSQSHKKYDGKKEDSIHIQNQLNPTKNDKLSLKSPKDESVADEYHFVFQINSMGRLSIQVINVTLTNDSNYSTCSSPLTHINSISSHYSSELIFSKTYQVNSTIYMSLNYKKPPIITYILLNARNFNTRAGIYTKFIFIQDEETWAAFFIASPIVLVLIVACGFALKKHQPKETFRKRRKFINESSIPSEGDLIFSDQSRSLSSSTVFNSNQKQEKIIQIEESDEDQSNNYRKSFQEEQYSPRFGYIPPDKLINLQKNKQSSVLESPFKSYHESNYPDDLSQSEIDNVQEFKQQAADCEEDHEILSLLVSKNKSAQQESGSKNSRNSFV